MRAEYHMQGAMRKSLVMALSEITGEPMRYLGVPTCAYQVGEYTIGRDGSIKGPIQQSVLDGLKEKGFIAENEEEIMEAFLESETEEPETEESPDRLTIEVPRDGISEETLELLKQYAASKATLLMHALAADDLPILVTEEKIAFPWFRIGTPEENAAYAELIAHLVETMKKSKRVISKDRKPENEKYAFRVVLLHLGFIGPEYRSTRRILLGRLTGNSAYYQGRPRRTAAVTEQVR